MLAGAAPATAALADTVMAGATGVAAGARPARHAGMTAPAAPPPSSPSQARPSPPVGARIGHYEILELGRGGMGVVFLARDTRLARLVAIKLLTMLSSAGVQRFLVEARATARCKHEHIVWCSSTSRGRASAAGWSSAGPWTPARRCRRRRWISSPRTSCSIKVVDFGIAKPLEEEASLAADRPGAGDARLTRDGGIIGTLPYMSPEQWRGVGIDASSDVWAVGILLHELVLGAHPLAPCDRMVLLGVPLLEEPMPEVRARRPELGALGALIDRCLRKSKAERFASAEELLAELLPLLPALPGRGELRLGADESPFAGLSFRPRAGPRGRGRAAAAARARGGVGRGEVVAGAGGGDPGAQAIGRGLGGAGAPARARRSRSSSRAPC
ncbi:hypothetical protein BE20_11110 [Sorangium cellulosum]|nr:hypothetical protein BE20_11110 [Sorangium cellulosum]